MRRPVPPASAARSHTARTTRRAHRAGDEPAYLLRRHRPPALQAGDASGAAVERNAYDPWGKRRFWNNGADDPSGSITSQTIRGFTGEEMLASVGLVHLNGRVYDPYIGRMTSADPVVGDPLNGQTWKRYSYVYNNPLAFTDPTGYCPICLGTFF